MAQSGQGLFVFCCRKIFCGGIKWLSDTESCRYAGRYCFYRRQMRGAPADSNEKQILEKKNRRLHYDSPDPIRACSGQMYLKTSPVTISPKRIPTMRSR